jgi:hypothetical protein
MKKLLLILGLVGIFVLGGGYKAGVQAGVVSKEEVLFMDIPEVVTSLIKAAPINKLKIPAGGLKATDELR